jgi:DNA-3-methyladenine glycosylase
MQQANLYPDWLGEDVLAVAPRLIGCTLVNTTSLGPAGGVIVETEAYAGSNGDAASHAYRGQTARTAPMFESGGTVYLYRSYGIHICLNLVTGPAGQAQAVLIRALAPTVGLDLMAARRHTGVAADLCRGPGRVGQALGLALRQSGTRLGEGSLQLYAPETPPPEATIGRSRRIGITQAKDNLWRWYLKGSPYVSGPPSLRQ